MNVSCSASSQAPVPPQTATAIQCDGHPDVVLRENPAGNVAFTIPNGTVLGLYEEQGEHARVYVIDRPATHGWAKRSNLQLGIRKAIACQREGHPDVVIRDSPAGPLKRKVPNGTVCGILKDNDDDIQVWIENDAATIGWIKRWNLQLDGIAKTISPLVAVDQPSYDDFISPQTLVDYVMWARVCWLKGSYLMTLERFRRCQEIPNEAFATSQELEEWSKPIHYPGSPRPYAYLISISHPWWARGEPDPEGHQLETIKAFTYSLEDDFSLGITRQTRAIFYDYACLPQQPDRSAEQITYFKRALEYMHLLYIHQSTFVLLMDEHIPEHAVNATPYMARGWCVFERRIANLSPGGCTYSMGLKLWFGGTALILTPDEFRDELQSLTFAAAHADRALVGDLYAKVYFALRG